MVLAFEAGTATAGLKQPQGSATTVATGSLAADNGIYCSVQGLFQCFSKTKACLPIKVFSIFEFQNGHSIFRK